MATATRPHGITLTLHEAEAEALVNLLSWHVAGDSVYRELLTNNILKELRRAGVEYDEPYRDSSGARCPVIVISKKGMGR